MGPSNGRSTSGKFELINIRVPIYIMSLLLLGTNIVSCNKTETNKTETKKDVPEVDVKKDNLAFEFRISSQKPPGEYYFGKRWWLEVTNRSKTACTNPYVTIGRYYRANISKTPYCCPMSWDKGKQKIKAGERIYIIIGAVGGKFFFVDDSGRPITNLPGPVHIKCNEGQFGEK